MGFNLTWVSVKDSHRMALLRALHLRPSGQLTVDLQDGVGGRTHGTDGYVIVAIDDRGSLLNPVLLEQLSRSVPLLVCHVHEGCMYSQAAEWSAGIEVWRVTYDGDRSEPFEIAGHPPPALKDICAEKQAAAGRRDLASPHGAARRLVGPAAPRPRGVCRSVERRRDAPDAAARPGDARRSPVRRAHRALRVACKLAARSRQLLGSTSVRTARAGVVTLARLSALLGSAYNAVRNGCRFTQEIR